MVITNMKTAEKLGEGIGYLSYFDIKEELPMEKIAELVRFTHAKTKDGKNYIKVTLKDVNGILVYGAWFDPTINEDTLRNFGKYNKVFVSVNFYADLYQGMKHLKIKEMLFLDDEEITKELQSCFIAELPNREKYSNELLTSEYGDYTPIKQAFDKIGYFKAISTMYMHGCGSAKAGELLKIISYIYNQLEYTEISGPLVKLMSVYTLYFYSREVNTKTFEIQVNVLSTLRTFDHETSMIKSKFEDTPYKDMVKMIFEESERLLCKLMDIPVTSSISVELITKAIKDYDKLYKLSTYYTSAPKNIMISTEGDQLLNI